MTLPVNYGTALYTLYLRAYSLALTGGAVLIGSQTEHGAAAMALGAGDGDRTRSGSGMYLADKANVERRILDLVTYLDPPRNCPTASASAAA
jgi:hypothetical protein